MTAVTRARTPRALPVLLALAVCLAGAAVLLARVPHTRPVGDEPGWITSGYYYSELLLAADWDRTKWEGRAHGPWGSLNPHLGKWLVGVPLTLRDGVGEPHFSGYYDFDRSFAENVKGGRMPPEDVFRTARRWSAFFGVLCCLLVFVAAWLARDPWAGALAALLLVVNPLFVRGATRAMTDVHYNLFLLGLCVAAFWLVRAEGRKRQVLAAAACGLFGGLAASVKVTGIVIAAAIFLLLLLYLTLLRRTPLRGAVVPVSAFFAVALSLIYGLNPWFWPPRPGTAAQAAQTAPPPTGRGALGASQALKRRYPQLAHLSPLLRFPRLFRRWDRYMQRQTVIPSASWEGNRFRMLHRRLFRDYVTFPGEWVFLLAGLGWGAARVRASWRKREPDPFAVPLVFFLVNYVFILLFMKLNWERYYLPTVIAARILVACGMCSVAAACNHAWRRCSSLRASAVARAPAGAADGLARARGDVS